MPCAPDNPVINLCIEGSAKELQGERQHAADLYLRAWEEAVSDLERFIAAHYVARVQSSAEMKLKWDQQALNCALKTNDEFAIESMPSLYINLAKDYQEAGSRDKAYFFYHKALACTKHLRDRGVAKLVESAVLKHIGSLANSGNL